MKIVLLKSHFATQGGLEKYTLQLSHAFARRGCEVQVLTTSRDSLPDIPGVEMISLGKRSKFSLYHLLHFDRLCQKWLRENPVDCVFGMERNRDQTHYRMGSGVHAAFLKQRKLTDPLFKRLSFTLNPLHRTLLSFEKQAFESPRLKRIFPNSQMVQSELLTHFAISKEKCEVIHNGVEWEAFQKPFEKRLNYNPEKHHFLFIGNGYRRKGLLFLLKALRLFKNQTIHLSVVGKEKNIPFFQKITQKYQLNKTVTFHGPVLDPTPFYQKADTLVLPSIYDPFANVTLEALAMGLFVVTSRFNGAKEILNPETGCVIDELTHPESVKESLEVALLHPKIPKNAGKIRESIKFLDFSSQLDKIVTSTLQSL